MQLIVKAWSTVPTYPPVKKNPQNLNRMIRIVILNAQNNFISTIIVSFFVLVVYMANFLTSNDQELIRIAPK